MSVTELKIQASALSFEELSDLARHIRALALQKDPARHDALAVAETSREWLSQAEFENALRELERPSR